jgi:hypothetical protein
LAVKAAYSYCFPPRQKAYQRYKICKRLVSKSK